MGELLVVTIIIVVVQALTSPTRSFATEGVYQELQSSVVCSDTHMHTHTLIVIDND